MCLCTSFWRLEDFVEEDEENQSRHLRVTEQNKSVLKFGVLSVCIQGIVSFITDTVRSQNPALLGN